ncbi:MAG: aminodeoxychorismate synthase component I, partial [Gammaproteobacteria bacterium]|nr:aminodeoxychorismate synthase component I [Gammaproteobacteria bacterium]
MSSLALDFPYQSDSAALFAPFAQRPWSVFLDSGQPQSEQGRYDIISWGPRSTLVTRGAISGVRDGDQLSLSREDPFLLLQRMLGVARAGVENLPFCGGAIGYFGYDLARRL